MQNFLKNKTALITGATSGIGRQLAYDLAVLGTKLILVARDENKLKGLKAELKEEFEISPKLIPLDVRDKDAVFSNLSPLKPDILVNNAGLALGIEPFFDANVEDWEVMIDTNLKGLLYVTKAVLSNMKDLDTAHIVNLGSVAGKTAYPGGNVYCATKAALKSLNDALNVDLFGTNVKVSNIAPGAVETNFSNIRFKGDKDKANKVYEGYTPLCAKDISKAIVFILNTPKHVNIQYLDIMPTAQRNPYMLDRKS